MNRNELRNFSNNILEPLLHP